jgi:hypothetical protein
VFSIEQVRKDLAAMKRQKRDLESIPDSQIDRSFHETSLRHLKGLIVCTERWLESQNLAKAG